MLALARAVSSFAVYGGVRAYLTNSMERTLTRTAEGIVADYLVPLNAKGDAWFLSEMSEAYPAGISDPFVRISQGSKILYESGDMREPPVRVTKLSLPTDSASLKTFPRVTAQTGQSLMIYTLAFASPRGSPILVEP